MDPATFDEIAKLFAARRLSRRQALTRSGAGLAAALTAELGVSAAAQPAPPATEGFAVLTSAAPFDTAIAPPTTGGAHPSTTYLFLQSFGSGSLVPKPGSPGRYTLTLKQGLGDTVYFSDRPAKIVGTVPTAQFLKGLGFTPANPPNAALVGQRSPSHKDIVVVELFDPTYDPATNTSTYEVRLLQDWRKLGETFEQTPDDAAEVPRDFTAAHLFIDDLFCSDDVVNCFVSCESSIPPAGNLGSLSMCWNFLAFACEPCTDWSVLDATCNLRVPACSGACFANYPLRCGVRT